MTRGKGLLLWSLSWVENGGPLGPSQLCKETVAGFSPGRLLALTLSQCVHSWAACPQGTSGSAWRLVFWLSQLGCYWHLVGGWRLEMLPNTLQSPG